MFQAILRDAAWVELSEAEATMLQQVIMACSVRTALHCHVSCPQHCPHIAL